MVVKLRDFSIPFPYAFESSVILNGSQTLAICVNVLDGFESSVILNGSQTYKKYIRSAVSLRVV